MIFWKKNVKDMSLNQIKSFTMDKIENLMANLEQQNLHNLVEERFSLQDKWEIRMIEPNFKSNESILFTYLASLKYFPHQKEKHYNKEQISEISYNVRKYPNNLSEIRKGLKISWTSFQRLLKEWETFDQSNVQSECNSIHHSNLNNVEQTHIAKLWNLQHILQVFLKFRIMLNKDLNKDLKPYWIRDFIKNKLRYSFKRGSSRNKRAKSSTSIPYSMLFSPLLF